MLAQMRHLIVAASTRLPVRFRSKLSPMVALAGVLFAAGCAHVPTAGRPQGPTRPIVNEDAGFAFELPTSLAFGPGSGRDNVVVRSQAGVRVRLFPEHFVQPPNETACWERLLVRHIPPQVAQRPTTPAGLTEVATTTGLETGDGRLLFLQVAPRGFECVVLVVEGTPGPTQETAAVALPTLRVFDPSAEVRKQLLVDAALQLQQMDETAAALDRFAVLFSAGEVSPRALALAGAVAFQEGGARLTQAIEWLERAVRVPPDVAFPDTFPSEANALFSETLMHLGLAYAQSGRFEEAVARLAEAAVRVPDDPIITYNFACGLALAGQSRDALLQLGDAFRLDPKLAAHARTDPDLVSLHGLPEWAALLAQYPS